MMRGTANAGNDLHARFAAWLRDGAAADPPRDLAVHAAHCVRCRAAMLALDDLLLVDPGRASIPPSRTVVPERPGVVGRPRALAAASAMILVGAAIAWIGLGALAPGFVGDLPSRPSTDQGVLGGFGAGASPPPSTAPSLGGLGSESGAASTSAAPPSASVAVEPTLLASVTARPVPSSRPPTPSQPASRTAEPSRAPVSTATATAEPTPTPTPAPDQSFALDDCENGLDDDGDTYVDGDDPGCVLHGDEASA